MGRPRNSLFVFLFHPECPTDRPGRGNRRYRMLVDKLLLPHGLNDNREIVKPLHISLQLETIHKMYADRDILLANLVQKAVLNHSQDVC